MNKSIRDIAGRDYKDNTLYKRLKDSNININRMKVVESDSRFIMLIRNPDTDMIELGMAIEKGNMNVHNVESRHVGMLREFLNKFKDMTHKLIDDTKNIDIASLLDDSDEDKELLLRYGLKWKYYMMIFDKVWIHECREFSNLRERDTCHEHWKQFYKDKELEILRNHMQQILEWFDIAIKNLDKIEWAIKMIKEDLEDI